MALSPYLAGQLAAARAALNANDLDKRVNGNQGEVHTILAAILEVTEELAAVSGSIDASLGMPIPEHDYLETTLLGATNNIGTIVYKTGGSGGTVVATVTITYHGGAVADDDEVATVTLT